MKPLLILDIGTDVVRAGLFEPKRLKPLSFHMAHIVRGEEEGLKKALISLKQELARAGAKGFCRVIAGIPAGLISIRILELPFDDIKKVEEVLPYELGDLLPVGVDNIVAGAVPLAGGRVLAAAVEKDVLKNYIDLLEELDMDPFRVVSTIFSMGELLAGAKGEKNNAVLVTPESVTVLFEGMTYLVKPLTDPEALKLTIDYLKAEGVRVDTFYTLGVDISEVRRLVDGKEVTGMSLPEGVPVECAGIYALALHLKRGFKGALNFRKGEFGYPKERLKAKKSLTLTGVLVFLALSMILGHVYFGYLDMERKFQMHKRALKEEYLRLFPGESRVVDELYLLETKLKRADEELEIMGQGTRVLDIMKALADAVKKGGVKVRFNELRAGGGRVVVKGEAGSFEEANGLKEILENKPPFGKVLISDVKAGGGSKTFFTLSITLEKRFGE